MRSFANLESIEDTRKANNDLSSSSLKFAISKKKKKESPPKFPRNDENSVSSRRDEPVCKIVRWDRFRDNERELSLSLLKAVEREREREERRGDGDGGRFN